jgi:hypothetical protein
MWICEREIPIIRTFWPPIDSLREWCRLLQLQIHNPVLHLTKWLPFLIQKAIASSEVKKNNFSSPTSGGSIFRSSHSREVKQPRLFRSVSQITVRIFACNRMSREIHKGRTGRGCLCTAIENETWFVNPRTAQQSWTPWNRQKVLGIHDLGYWWAHQRSFASRPRQNPPR